VEVAGERGLALADLRGRQRLGAHARRVKAAHPGGLRRPRVPVGMHDQRALAADARDVAERSSISS
jgi:hypothetical protein